MSRGERFVVLGLAHARAAWFTDVARWATAAALPVEFGKCVSAEELRARLGSGRALSALLLDAGLPGVDRDLVDRGRAAGAAVILVGPAIEREWMALGAAAALPRQFSRAQLLETLEAHARPVGRGDEALALDPAGSEPASAWRGALVTVTGVRGTGTSTVARAVAQGLGADVRHGGLVVLADLALDADQALLHDAGDVVPGLPELVDAHRRGQPSVEEIHRLTFDVPAGYHLLLGLRRHRDWAALRPRAVEAALDGLRRSYRVVVADVDPDLEGEAQCGSLDVEERNLLARTATAAADVVLAVGQPGVRGLTGLIRLLRALAEHGVALGAIVPVLNRAPRGHRARAELAAAVGELSRTSRLGTGAMPSPVFIPERRRLEELARSGSRLPASVTAPVTSAVSVMLDRARAAPALAVAGVGSAGGGEPTPVVPGSLGHWAED